MTISSTTRRAGPFVGNGVTTSFPFTFKVFATSDVVVTLTTIATGVESTLVETTNYTVALNADQNANPGGSVTYNPAGVPMPATQELTLTSNVPQLQTLDLTNGGGFFPAVISAALDRAVILIQQLALTISGCLRTAVSDTAPAALPTKATRALNFLAFDANGDPIASAGGASTPVSVAMAPVVAAATLAAGRTAFGVLASGAAAVGAVDLAAASLGFTLINGKIVASVGGSALTLAIKTNAGNDPSAGDPMIVVFRNATAATGDYTALLITAANSLVISSGSTMGATNNIPFRLWLVGFNDAGTFRMGAVNCLSGTTIMPLRDDILASSTAEGGAGGADSAQVIYAGTAVAAKPMRVLGFVEWSAGLAAVGTYGIVPTKVHNFSVGTTLPGQVVQTVSGYSASGSSTTSTSMVDVTNGSLAITPTNAANPVMVRFGFTLTSSALGATNTIALANILRAAVNISGVDQLLTQAPSAGGGTGINAGISFAILDTPNAVVSTTYKIQQKTNNAGSAAGTVTISKELQEIMG